MKSRWPLTVRGSGAVVLAIACFALAPELGSVELLYFGILLLVLVGACILALHTGRRAERVERVLEPEVVSVGGTAYVRLSVTMRSLIPTTTGLWTDHLSAGLMGESAGVLPGVGSALRRSATETVFSYPVQGMLRGQRRIGPLEIRTSDPFGIARRVRRVGGTDEVVVVPAIVPLTSLGDHAGDLGGSLRSSSDDAGQGADNLTARPYMPGDSMRRIHWRATAHHDLLMVREEERESTPEATVILDRSAARWHPDAARTPGADPRFETALTAFVSIVHRLTQDGYLVDVLDGDGTALVSAIAGDSRDEIAALLHLSATLTTVPEDQLPHLRPLFAGGMAGPVALVTGALSEADARSMSVIASHSALPVLLSAAPADGAFEVAAHSWRVGLVDDEAALSDAWAQAVGRGVSRAHF